MRTVCGSGKNLGQQERDPRLNAEERTELARLRRKVEEPHMEEKRKKGGHGAFCEGKELKYGSTQLQ